MRYTVSCETTLAAVTAGQAWDVWSDLAAYPQWDPREELNAPGGPLGFGMVGPFKQRGRGAGIYEITAVDPGRGWTSESALPGGRLVIEHGVLPMPTGTKLVKRYTAIGPMAPAFRWFFARGIRAEMPRTFAALRTEIARRYAAVAP